MSQVDVAVKADLYQRTISDIERGVAKRPVLRTLQALADALDMPLADLAVAAGWSTDVEDAKRLEDAMHDADHDPTLTQLLWEVNELDEGGRKLLTEQARAIRRWQRSVSRVIDTDDDEGK